MVEDTNINNDIEKLSVEVYKDAISPAAKEVGKMVALPFQAINVALSGARIWVAEKQYNYERTLELLAQKMRGISIDNISPPENYIAVPVLQQISYCYDSEELRNMYANLLASSMQNDKKWEIHPSFVDIIKQLSPDEAKILKKLNQVGREAIVSISASNEKGESLITYKDYSIIGHKAQCDNPKNTNIYIDNLCRLGLTVNGTGVRWLTEEELYNEIYKLDYVAEIINSIKGRKDEYNVPDYEKGYIELTSLGKSFCNTCIS